MIQVARLHRAECHVARDRPCATCSCPPKCLPVASDDDADGDGLCWFAVGQMGSSVAGPRHGHSRSRPILSAQRFGRIFLLGSDFGEEAGSGGFVARIGAGNLLGEVGERGPSVAGRATCVYLSGMSRALPDIGLLCKVGVGTTSPKSEAMFRTTFCRIAAQDGARLDLQTSLRVDSRADPTALVMGIRPTSSIFGYS